mgnify:CR=1 FL=1
MDTQVFKIADVERDTGLSKDVLRVWERRYGFPAPDRDRNGDRSYSAQQVEHLRLIKRLMDAGQRPGKLLGVPVEDLVRLNPAREAAVEPGAPGLEASRSVATSGLYELVAMLRSHDGDAFLRAMQQRLAGYGVHRFVLDVVAPLAAEVGQAWAQGRFAIFEEHLFSELTQRMLRQAIASLPATARSPRIVLTTVSNETHGLGLLMAEALLALHGAECIPMGTQMPLTEIQGAAVAHRADVVALSFSSFFPRRKLPGLLVQLRQMLDSDVALWVGGSALHGLPKVPGVDFLHALDDVPDHLERWRACHPLALGQVTG